ncbi:polysaccharide biosynthesis protein [Coralloluteibacterium stylophorae]|uniref:Polysaccharide biosynthesis protein n=1 Tax=Coralloluteibacterium stylophorae TaxID=1776034 RepID=A0AAP2C8T2_9GAMM|nr:nucleoside-diphosphate sugar epimerase/dehydratase [Coralloluteibacterium stylophorae]MBS7455975.1 polysaccharide biosynthesis protein [Coralloluteibacterium stylophorae]
MMPWKDRVAAWLPRLTIVLHDLGWAAVSWLSLMLLRYSYAGGAPSLGHLRVDILIVLVIQGLVFWRVGLYRGLWRFASVPDLVNILKACLIGTALILVVQFLHYRAEELPRTVLALYPLVLSFLLATPRFLYRAWKDTRDRGRGDESHVRVLILGAGRAGEALVRDLQRDARYHVVGLVDDDARLHGAKVHGLPVLGGLNRLMELAHETAVEMLVIAMPSATQEQMHEVVARCEETRLPFRTVPRLDDVLQGRVAPGELKEVAIEDLLGRAPVAPDWQAVRRWLGGRSVLVTGAGGSIGSELCRQCAMLGVARIVLVERYELALVRIATELGERFPDLAVVPVLGDCGDAALMRKVLRRTRPQAVFHAAAYKQVPLLEDHVREAVRNNALATAAMARVSRDAGVGTFVLISTDKAVNPVNILGASKRLAELACQVLAEGTETQFVTVRFGNVLDSAGSVVPLFREQIRTGGPVTVTHPEVTRYFMTIPEACQLILQAAAIDTHEAIYTLDMGQPVPIRLLAEQMIRLAGKTPGEDIAIEYTGLRPGERLHETLFHDEEDYRRTAHSKILLAVPRRIDSSVLRAALAAAEDAVVRCDDDALRQLLQATMPDFQPAQAAPPYLASAVVTPFPAIKKEASAQ